MIEGERFARKCSSTGEGINQGYVVNGGEFYYKDLKELSKFHKLIEWNDMFENTDSYWTDWDVEDEDWYYEVKNGVLVEVYK